MVQGRLLTAHPGGVHGDGGAPRGDSSLWQGAGTASPGSPDLETAVAAVQRGHREKDLYIRDFLDEVLYRRRGAAKRATRGPDAPLVRPSPRVRQQGVWVPGGGP